MARLLPEIRIRSWSGNDPLCLSGRLDVSEERCQIIADDIVRLEDARVRSIREVQILIRAKEFSRQDMERLGQILSRHPGPCPTYLHVVRERYETRISLEKHMVAATHELLAALAERVASAEARFVS